MADLLTLAAVFHMVTQTCGLPPGAPAEVLSRIVWHETRGNPAAINTKNANGTVDYGLAQINSSNFSWLGLTPETALDPCKNLAAADRYLRALSLYCCGSPTKGYILKPPGAKVPYVEDIWNAKWPVNEGKSDGNVLAGRGGDDGRVGSGGVSSIPTRVACAAPSWDVWGQAECRDHPPAIVPVVSEEIVNAEN